MHCRSLVPASLGLSLLVGVGHGGDEKKADDIPLKEVAQKTASLASYAFKINEGNAGDKEPPRISVEGKFEKGKPIFFKADKIEFFKQGNVVAYKDGDNWHKSKTGTLSDPLRILGGVAKVRAARMPHEEFADLAKLLKNVKEATPKARASTMYLGTLDEPAAKKLAPTALASVARDGRATIWLDDAGKLSKYSLRIRVQGTLGNAEIDGQITRTVTLSEQGMARIELPEEAKKALE